MHLSLGTLNVLKIITVLQAVINNNTIIVGDFSNQFLTMDRSSRQKVNKKTLDFMYV